MVSITMSGFKPKPRYLTLYQIWAVHTLIVETLMVGIGVAMDTTEGVGVVVDEGRTGHGGVVEETGDRPDSRRAIVKKWWSK